MQLKFVLFAVFATAFEIIYATDYCSSSLCSSSTHIACNNTGAFASRCVNATLASFTQTTIDLIVSAHNTKRNLVASGSTKLEPACRMATIQWDDELAYLAELNVKQCQMKHDACHNTASYKYSGQNLAWIGFYGTADVASLAEQGVGLWYDEIAYVNMTYINKYPSNYSGETIGHFTVMVADRNIRLGCAASTYAVTGQSYKAFLFACNYATTNVVGYPIYDACTTAAADCTTGVNANYTSLCSESETYDVNTFY